MDWMRHAVLQEARFLKLRQMYPRHRFALKVRGGGVGASEGPSLCVVFEFPSSEDVDSSLFCEGVSSSCWEVD